MDNKLVSIAALLLALTACVLAAVVFVRGDRPSEVAAVAASSASTSPERPPEAVALTRVESARPPPTELQAPPVSSSRETMLTAELEKLTERLAKIETALAALEKTVSTAPPPPARRPMTKEQVEKLQQAQRVALDYGATEKERVEALDALRGRMIEDKSAITEDVVVAMIALAEQSPDEKVRGDVYKNLHNTKSNTIRDSMLRALANDPSAKVRARAAQDIDVYIADSFVVDALKRAAAGDSDPDVRTAAERTLAGGR